MAAARRTFALTMLVLAWACGTPPCRAQGIPVIDIANLTQAVQNVQENAQRYEQLAQTIAQLRSTHSALTGLRNLAAAFNNPALQNYLPPASYKLLDAVSTSGSRGLTTRAAAERNAGMVYNCLELTSTARTACQAMLALPYQYRAMIADALDRSQSRVAQINALMQMAAQTQDPKAIAEAQARIGAESALLAHETSQAQLAAMAMESTRQTQGSRALEAQLANLARPIR